MPRWLIALIGCGGLLALVLGSTLLVGGYSWFSRAQQAAVDQQQQQNEELQQEVDELQRQKEQEKLQQQIDELKEKQEGQNQESPDIIIGSSAPEGRSEEHTSELQSRQYL